MQGIRLKRTFPKRNPISKITEMKFTIPSDSQIVRNKLQQSHVTVSLDKDYRNTNNIPTIIHLEHAE